MTTQNDAVVEEKLDGVSIVALGGVGEMGMNHLVLTVDGKRWLIDSGVNFPGESERFAEKVLPDLDWIRDRADSFGGMILTHGHEDHVGSVPFVLQECPMPVYGGPFALELVKRKLDEHNMRNVDLRLLTVGTFGELPEPLWSPEQPDVGFSFIRVTHSIPDCASLVITTPYGRILHTGDFRIDPHPIDGQHFDKGGFEALGDAGVLAMMSDSTNANVPGRTISERDVIEEIGNQMAGHKGRVLLTTFASNVQRLRGIQQVAHEHGRKVCLLGRSLTKYSEVAEAVGITGVDTGALVDSRRLDRIPDDKLLIVLTGSQGERRAALFKAATGRHPALQLGPQDLLLISARIIPGNEVGVYGLINELRRRGVKVVTAKTVPIHTSGHARQEELKELIRLVRPDNFIPVHGEYDFLLKHRELAIEAGVPADRTVVIENGEELTITDEGFHRSATFALDSFYLDGSVVGDADELGHKARQRMFYNGAISVFVDLLVHPGGKLDADVEIQSQGVFTRRGDLLNKAANIVADAIESLGPQNRTDSGIEDAVGMQVRRFFRRETGKKPLTFTFIRRHTPGTAAGHAQ